MIYILKLLTIILTYLMHQQMRFHGSLAINNIVYQTFRNFIEFPQIIHEKLLCVLSEIGFFHLNKEILDYLVALVVSKVVEVYGFHGQT